jgi:hypothetical protein
MLRKKVSAMKANKWPVAVLAVLGLAAAGDAMADWGHHHHHGPRVEFGVVIGPSYYWGPWRYPPYYYPPYPYYPPVVVEQTAPPVYIQQQPAPAPAPAAQSVPPSEYWYYCPTASAYYPYVKECPAGWQKVAPTPPR